MGTSLPRAFIRARTQAETILRQSSVALRFLQSPNGDVPSQRPNWPGQVRLYGGVLNVAVTSLSESSAHETISFMRCSALVVGCPVLLNRLRTSTLLTVVDRVVL